MFEGIWIVDFYKWARSEQIITPGKVHPVYRRIFPQPWFVYTPGYAIEWQSDLTAAVQSQVITMQQPDKQLITLPNIL